MPGIVATAELLAGVAAAISIGVGGTPASTGLDAPATSPFGVPEPVHVARVGSIEVDLEPARPGELRRVSCAFAVSGTRCFVAAPARSTPNQPG